MQSLKHRSPVDSHLLTVTPDTSIEEAISLMSKRSSSYVLVVADNNPESPLVGVFTERDVIRLATAGIKYASLSIAVTMTKQVVTIGENASQDIFSAIKKLQEHRIRHLPIVNKIGNPVGIITPESIREAIKPIDLLRHKKVSEVMPDRVIHATKTASVIEVAQLMIFHRVSCIVIVETADILKAVGIITERDIVQFCNIGLNLETIAVGEVMSTPIFTIKSEDSMWNANQIMEKYRVRRLVVLNESGELTGIITQTGILSAINPIEMWQATKTLQQIVDFKTFELKKINREFQEEIAKRKQAEASLQESQRWLEAITKATPNIIYVYDIIERRNIYCNREIGEILGYTPAEIQEMGSNILADLMHPEDFTKVPEHFQKFDTAPDGDIIEIEYRVHHKNGEWRWFVSRDTVFARNTDSSPKQILGSIKDITDRKQAEVALQESQTRLQKLAANIPGMVYEFQLDTGGDFNFSYVSSGCLEICELTPEQIQENSENCWQQVHSDDLQSIHDSIALSARDLSPWHWEGRIITPSGKLKWIQGISRPEKQENGNILWYGILIDASDRKFAEEALRQKTTELEETLLSLQQTQAQLIHSEKMSSLGQLVAGIAHEINNPISFIYSNLVHIDRYFSDLLSYIDFCHQQISESVLGIQEPTENSEIDFIKEDLPKIVKSMKNGAERIRNIVVNLRNFSQHDRSDIVEADLHECLDNTLLILSHRLREKSNFPPINIVKSYGNLPKIPCMARDLNQVFMNIISNAIDALQMGGWDAGNTPEDNLQCLLPAIQISTEVDDSQQVKIEIHNNGPYIPQAVQQKIFDPFFTTKPIGKGTGLGLYASYQIIVEKHRGKLECISERDRGTSFIIYLPIEQLTVVREF